MKRRNTPCDCSPPTPIRYSNKLQLQFSETHPTLFPHTNHFNYLSFGQLHSSPSRFLGHRRFHHHHRPQTNQPKQTETIFERSNIEDFFFTRLKKVEKENN